MSILLCTTSICVILMNKKSGKNFYCENCIDFKKANNFFYRAQTRFLSASPVQMYMHTHPYKELARNECSIKQNIEKSDAKNQIKET